MLTSEQVLTHYDPALPVKLACDPSPTSISAVLSHVMPDGSERSVPFVSRSLTETERSYAPIDKEALSILWGMKSFHVYLYGAGGGDLRSLPTTSPLLPFSTLRREFLP